MEKEGFSNDYGFQNINNSTTNINDDSLSVSENSQKSKNSMIDSYLSRGIKVYKVFRYSPNCEEHNQINYIIPLARTTTKFILFIILNILTIGIINIFVAWFPKLILYIYYSETELQNATHLGIFSKEDNEFEVVEKKIIDLPPIDYDSEFSIVKKLNLNIEHGAKQITIFEYKLFKYIYSPLIEGFEAISYRIKSQQNIIVEDYSRGLNPNEALYMKKIFGICDIDIQINSCGKLLFEELTDPFYLFQLYSVILWYSTNYYLYASVIVALAILSLVLSVYGTYKNLKKIQEISRYSCPVRVYRLNENNEYIGPFEMNSTELVPGDMFEIPEDDLALPCDAILISGSVIVNESMLTGESTPVIKVHMPETHDIYDTDENDCEKYILFAGTKIVQKRRIGKMEPAGIVFRTGFNTFKGNLIAGILYPKKDDDSFTSDSVKYIIFMCIMTIVGFFITLKFLIVEGELSFKEIVIRFLDLFTTAVPPSLAACLSIGITYSLSRLNDRGVFCIQRDRINKAGSVNILVFDKTGTLTEDHLDINGFVSVRMNQNKQFEFNPFNQSCTKDSDIVIEYFKSKNKNNIKNINLDLLQYYIECLACCHCLTYVKEKLLGDPIDVRMFESVEWIMKENMNTGNENNINPLVLNFIRPKCEEDLNIPFSNNNNDPNLQSRYEIAIVKRFDFSSKLQRMTIIGKNLNENFFKAYCKGSPEKIRELSDPSTLPLNFDEILNSYTTKGFRVLGMAAKSINMTLEETQIIPREEVEKNMIFLGLLIVQNKLKEKTKSSLALYDEADLRMLMATGDNILTAICVAKECNLIRVDKEMASCDIDKENGIDILKWNILEGNENKTQNEMDNQVNQNDENNIEMNNINQNHDYLNENTQNTLFDLYPPENFNSMNKINEGKYEEKLENEKSEVNKKSEDLENHLINKTSKSLKDEKVIKRFYSKNSIKLIPKTPPLIVKEEDFPFNLFKDDTFGIALTGSTFERLSNLNDEYLKKKNPNLKGAHEAFRLILKKGRVFARMAPEHKALLVDSLKKEGFTTLMCGDGANDCAALRTAHVSVSLSPEEASIAANFTSREPDVSCIYELLREGKCSLTTSFQTFKYMMLYSMIQFICVSLCMIYTTYLTDFQFLVSDLFIIFPLEWFLAMTKPYHKLTHRYPISSLISFPIISSIITHSLIEFAFQFGGYRILKNHYGWYNVCDFDKNDTAQPCHENTIFFLIALFQYLGSAIAFFVSKPFRQEIYTNWILMIYLAGAYFYSIWITINCDNWSRKLFDLYELEKYGNYEYTDEEDMEEMEEFIPGGKHIKHYILLIVGINTVVSIFIEWFVMQLVNRCYERNQINQYKREIENYKLLKQNPNPKEEIKDVEIYKYHRVYYDDRRQARNQLKKNNKNL